MYHHAILKRDESELTLKIHKEQINNTTAGDFVELLAKDFALINVRKNDDEIRTTNTPHYKNFIKNRIKASAFKYSKMHSVEW